MYHDLLCDARRGDQPSGHSERSSVTGSSRLSSSMFEPPSPGPRGKGPTLARSRHGVPSPDSDYSGQTRARRPRVAPFNCRADAATVAERELVNRGLLPPCGRTPAESTTAALPP